MSRIDDLITAHCPTGVVFKPLASVVRRTENIRWSEQADKVLQYIDLTSVDRRTHEITNTAAISRANAPSRAQQIVETGDVIFGTTRPMLKRYSVIPAEYDGHVCSTGFCVLRPDTKLVMTNFLFHLLGTDSFYEYIEANQRGASYPAIADSVVKGYRIAVPPLPVQREIVKVLDAFTKLEADLEGELDRELEGRRRQYQYFRDALLSFGEPVTEERKHVSAVWATLGEIGTFTRGRRFTKSDYVSDGIGCIHYADIYTQYETAATKAISRVRADLATTLRFAQPGDIVIAAVGETVEDVGKAVAWLGSDEVAVHDDCFTFHHSMNPKFVSYYFQTKAFNAEKNKYVARAKVKRLSGEDLAKLAIPVPPVEEQARVVAILDKFNALGKDLSIGLLAELKGRRRQYLHYHNQLLTFLEAA
jgi:type I restriction enzyme S subunit